MFDVSGKIKRTHSFFVTQFDSHILERFTEDFGVSGVWNDESTFCAIEIVVSDFSVILQKNVQLTKRSLLYQS